MRAAEQSDAPRQNAPESHGAYQNARTRDVAIKTHARSAIGPAGGARARARRAAARAAGDKVAYVCGDCGWDSAQWVGKCGGCGAWNTLKAFRTEPAAAKKGSGGGGGARAARAALSGAGRREGGESVRSSRGGWLDSGDDAGGPRSLSDVGDEIADRKREFRRSTGAGGWRTPLAGAEGAELMRVLGGGVVPGSLTLVGGEPGVGKSTLLLQLAAMMTRMTPDSQARESNAGGEANGAGSESGVEARDASGTDDAGKQVLYVSGEESEQQIHDRATRLAAATPDALTRMLVHSSTSVDEVLEAAVELRPAAIIVDSIQTVYLDGVSGSAGSVTQVRECAAALLRVAKSEGIPIMLVGHVTKGGEIAGPRVLEHIVDTVLYLESDASGGSCRMLRAFKNRFGPTDEVGLFEMGAAGVRALPDVSRLFLSDASASGSSPSAVVAALEGSRGMMVEVQSLANELPEYYDGPPKRVATGLDHNRVHMMLAIMAKSARLPAYGYEVYLNVTGGAKLTDPASDLAVCVAVASSMRDVAPAPRVAYCAEVGLGGELRPVSQLARRLKEAQRMGFDKVIVAGGAAAADARAAAEELGGDGIEVVPCARLIDALAIALDGGGSAHSSASKPRARRPYRKQTG